MAFQYKFGFGGFFNGRGVGANTCVHNIQTDGTWNGHIAGSGSTINPLVTITGLVGYELKWDATDTTGEVQLALGVAGDEQEPNANDIAIAKDGRGAILSWDDTAKRYIGDNLEFTTYLNTLFVVGEEVCVTTGFLPVELIHYDFADLDIGVKV